GVGRAMRRDREGACLITQAATPAADTIEFRPTTSLSMITTLFGPTEPAPDASKTSLLERLKAGIQKTRAGLMEKLEDAVTGRKEIDADVLDELEYALIPADIGAKTTAEILERIRQRVDRSQSGDIGELKTLIREHLLEIL